MKKIFLTLFLLFIGSALTAEAGTLFKSTLSGAQEVPTNNSIGTGFGTVQLNDAGTQATVNLRFTGLTSNQVGAHIHGNAPAGQNAPILFSIGVIGGIFKSFGKFQQRFLGDFHFLRRRVNLHDVEIHRGKFGRRGKLFFVFIENPVRGGAVEKISYYCFLIFEFFTRICVRKN